jgi:hypothetical protein
MDNQIKSGAKVWVLCDVVGDPHSYRVSCKYGTTYFRAFESDCKPVAQKVNKQETATLDAKKPGGVPQKGDWVTITKPANGNNLGWVSPAMDKYDGKTFQFEGELRLDNEDSLWAKGPEGYYFNLAWLKPWKPKSGDWVTITRPEDTEIEPGWATCMDVYLGKPQMLHSEDFNDLWYLYDYNEPEGSSYYCFDLKWLSPAEAPKAENKNLQPACVSKVDDVVNESQSTLATVDAPEIDSSMQQLNWNDTVQPGDLILNVETQYVVFAACSVGLKVDDAFFEAKKAGITRLFYRPIGRVPFNA